MKKAIFYIIAAILLTVVGFVLYTRNKKKKLAAAAKKELDKAADEPSLAVEPTVPDDQIAKYGGRMANPQSKPPMIDKGPFQTSVMGFHRTTSPMMPTSGTTPSWKSGAFLTKKI